MIYLLLTAALAAADLVLKHRAEQDPRTPIVKNTGFSFGVLKGKPAVVRGIPLLSSVVFGILWAMALGRKGGEGEKLSLSLIMAGAISNVYDRLKRGYVVDYINLKNPKKEQPGRIYYNLADLYVVTGALTGFLDMVRTALRLW